MASCLTVCAALAGRTLAAILAGRPLAGRALTFLIALACCALAGRALADRFTLARRPHAGPALVIVGPVPRLRTSASSVVSARASDIA